MSKIYLSLLILIIIVVPAFVQTTFADTILAYFVYAPYKAGESSAAQNGWFYPLNYSVVPVNARVDGEDYSDFESDCYRKTFSTQLHVLNSYDNNSPLFSLLHVGARLHREADDSPAMFEYEILNDWVLGQGTSNTFDSKCKIVSLRISK